MLLPLEFFAFFHLNEKCFDVLIPEIGPGLLLKNLEFLELVFAFLNVKYYAANERK